MICTTCKKEMAREVTQYKITYSCECGKDEFIKINTPFKLQSSILALKDYREC